MQNAALLRLLEILDDLRDGVEAHGEGHEINALRQLDETEGEAVGAGRHVRAGKAEQEADGDHGESRHEAALRQHDGEDQPEGHKREILGRAEQERGAGEGLREGREHERGDAAGEQRAERRHGERRPGAALPRHLVAVDAGHDR